MREQKKKKSGSSRAILGPKNESRGMPARRLALQEEDEEDEEYEEEEEEEK